MYRLQDVCGPHKESNDAKLSGSSSKSVGLCNGVPAQVLHLHIFLCVKGYEYFHIWQLRFH